MTRSSQTPKHNKSPAASLDASAGRMLAPKHISTEPNLTNLYLTPPVGNPRMLGYQCTFKVGHGTHQRVFESQSEEALALCTAALAHGTTLYVDAYKTNRLSRLISAAHKRFGVEWQAIRERSYKTQRKRRGVGRIVAYRLLSSVQVTELGLLLCQMMMAWPMGGSR